MVAAIFHNSCQDSNFLCFPQRAAASYLRTTLWRADNVMHWAFTLSMIRRQNPKSLCRGLVQESVSTNQNTQQIQMYTEQKWMPRPEILIEMSVSISLYSHYTVYPENRQLFCAKKMQTGLSYLTNPQTQNPLKVCTKTVFDTFPDNDFKSRTQHVSALSPGHVLHSTGTIGEYFASTSTKVKVKYQSRINCIDNVRFWWFYSPTVMWMTKWWSEAGKIRTYLC